MLHAVRLHFNEVASTNLKEWIAKLRQSQETITCFVTRLAVPLLPPTFAEASSQGLDMADCPA